MSLLYENLVRPLLFKFDPELAHELACNFMGFANRSHILKFITKSLVRTQSPSVRLFGLNFPGYVGQAAGLDKDGRFPGISSALGFSHIEVGTVTPGGQSGNARPRLFRYPEFGALVNRMGFNNKGSKALAEHISKFYPKDKRRSPLGINIGKSKNTPLDEAVDDYLTAFTDVAGQADYVAINISSPNTPDLRDLHQENYLPPLLKNIRMHNLDWAKKHGQAPLPCLLKISPDEDYKSLERIVSHAIDNSFDGIIATNTSADRKILTHRPSLEKGGLSGKPIENKSTQTIRFISRLTDFKFPIIGVGGIFNEDDASRKLDAGASLLQIYTSFVYNGPLFPSALANSLAYRKRRWS
ncbi:MAG: quinone-dependent dihydroorotate dehydrogenase [Opitutae bacterium]|nr:quinone-dependent dihydroorotate dehydrogenase [Opitutae bacterium]